MIKILKVLYPVIKKQSNSKDYADTYCNMGMSFNEKGDYKGKL